MSEKQYYPQEETSMPVTLHKEKHSIWSMFANFVSLLFSGLVVVISFLIATPFFILSVLVNWIKMAIGFAVFWFIADLIYVSIILDSRDFEPFTNTTIGTILILALIASIFVTVAEIRD